MKPGRSAGIGRVFGLVAILTVFSKFAGLARDVVLLQFFGTTVIADAYNYAYLLTGNILVLFGGLGGPFHQSTVAILTPKKDDEGIGRLTGQIFLYTALVLGALSVVLWFIAPYLVPLIWPAAGHTHDYQEQLWSQTISQIRIMLPLVVISGIVGIQYGVCNVYGQFFWPSLSPAIASVSIIFAIWGFAAVAGGLCLGWGTTVGAVGQMLAQIPGMLKAKLKWALPIKPEPGLTAYLAMLWPAAVSTSIGQLTVYVDACFTSQLHEGSWTAIVNANRLVQLPLGVLLTAMLVPILPRFTEQVSRKQIPELKEELRRALSFLWFLALPMAALMLAVPGHIIQLLFQRGHFTVESRELVTAALVFLIPSIFFYVARDLLTRVFYAHQDSTTPYYVAMCAIVVKFLLDWALVGPLGVGGISLATTLVTIWNLGLLSYLLRKKIGLLGMSQLIKPLAVMLSGSALAAGITYETDAFLTAHLAQSGFLSLLVSLLASCCLGALVYGGVCVAFRLSEPLMLIRRLRNKLGA